MEEKMNKIMILIWLMMKKKIIIQNHHNACLCVCEIFIHSFLCFLCFFFHHHHDELNSIIIANGLNNLLVFMFLLSFSLLISFHSLQGNYRLNFKEFLFLFFLLQSNWLIDYDCDCNDRLWWAKINDIHTHTHTQTERFLSFSFSSRK